MAARLPRETEIETSTNFFDAAVKKAQETFTKENAGVCTNFLKLYFIKLNQINLLLNFFFQKLIDSVSEGLDKFTKGAGEFAENVKKGAEDLASQAKKEWEKKD